MSEGYRPRHNISRQFTEAELAVSDRTTDHLTQKVDQMPAPRLSRFGTADEAYGWLEKDLERRDQNTARLAREMELAERQSLRRQLDVEANEDADRKASAADGVAKLSQWAENGFRSMEEAKQAYLKENPSASMNPDFNAAYANLSKDFKTDQQREVEEVAEKTNMLRGKLALGEAELTSTYYEKNPEALPQMIEAIHNAKVIGAFTEEEAANISRDLQMESYKRAKKNQTLFGQSADGDPNMSVMQKKGFKDAGMNVKLPSRLQSVFPANSTPMLMATDGYYLSSLGEEERSSLEASYNVLTNPKSTEEEKLEAQDAIESAAVDYHTYSSDLRKQFEDQEKLNSALPKGMTAIKDGVEANLSVVQAYNEYKTDSEVPSASIGVDAIIENARQTLLEIKAEFQSKGVPLEEYSEALKNIDAYGKVKYDDAKTKEEKLTALRDTSSKVNAEIKSLMENAMVAERKPTTAPKPTDRPDAGKLKPFDDEAKKAASKELSRITDPKEKKAAASKWAADNGYADPFASK